MVLQYSTLDFNTIDCMNELLSIDLPIKDALTAVLVSKKLNEHLEIKTKIEERLINKYAEKDENGRIVPIKDDKGNVTNDIYITDFNAYKLELEELNSQTFEIIYEKIDITTIKNIKPKIILKLEWLFSI